MIRDETEIISASSLTECTSPICSIQQENIYNEPNLDHVFGENEGKDRDEHSDTDELVSEVEDTV